MCQLLRIGPSPDLDYLQLGKIAFCKIQQENEKNKTVPEAINATLEQILPFYQSARTPTLFRNKMGQEIKKLWEDLNVYK